MINRDRHHILNPRLEWSLRPAARRLRGMPALIPRIDREAHEALHEHCPPVPLLGVYALMGTLERFEPTGYVPDDMDLLMQSIEKATRHRKVFALERDLAGLAIEAIELQRPYIIQGLVT